jgi:hypothetical protein
VVGPIQNLPLISPQPASVTNYSGGNVVFTVGAVNSDNLPMTYQWRKDGSPLSDGGKISGSTTTNLTLSNIDTNDAGSYDVKVTTSNGTSTSTPAILTVLASPLSDVTLDVYPGVSFHGIAGKHYHVEYRASLDPTNAWQTLADIASLTNAVYTSFDPTPTRVSQQRLYRVVFIP